MVHISLSAAYSHLNLVVTKENLLAAGFSAVPAVFLVNCNINTSVFLAVILIFLLKTKDYLNNDRAQLTFCCTG